MSHSRAACPSVSHVSRTRGSVSVSRVPSLKGDTDTDTDTMGTRTAWLHTRREMT